LFIDEMNFKLFAKKKQKNEITKFFPIFIQKKLQFEIKRE